MFFAKILMTVFLFYGALLLVVYIYQDKLLFYPDPEDFSKCQEMTAQGFVPQKIQSQDLKIRFYEKYHPENKGSLIFFHGNAGRACHRAFYPVMLGNLPLNYLFVEYPGYGGDDQKISQETILRTALGIYDYVEKGNSRNLPIFLFGESLGTGVALSLASQKPVTGLILQSPYSSLLDVGSHHYPLLPVKWLIKNPFLAQEWAAKIDRPVLILHGTDDEIIPLKYGRKLSLSFKRPPRMVEIPKAHHNDLMDIDPQAFWGEIQKFLTHFL